MKKKKRKRNLVKETTKTKSHSKTILLSWEYIKIININNKKKLSRESEPSLK